MLRGWLSRVDKLPISTQEALPPERRISAGCSTPPAASLPSSFAAWTRVPVVRPHLHAQDLGSPPPPPRPAARGCGALPTKRRVRMRVQHERVHTRARSARPARLGRRRGSGAAECAVLLWVVRPRGRHTLEPRLSRAARPVCVAACRAPRAVCGPTRRAPRAGAAAAGRGEAGARAGRGRRGGAAGGLF